MPVRLTLCHFGAPGWGEPWFPLSVVLLRLLTEFGMAVFVIVSRCGFASSTIPIPRMIQGYHHSCCQLLTLQLQLVLEGNGPGRQHHLKNKSLVASDQAFAPERSPSVQEWMHQSGVLAKRPASTLCKGSEDG